MATVNYTFIKPNPTSGADSELPYWVGATVHNSVIEQREYATQDGIFTAPEYLHILITNWNVGDFRGAAATPLWNKCHIQDAKLSTLQAFIQYFIAQQSFVFAPMGDLATILKNENDMVISYLAPAGDYNCQLTSATLKSTCYHELSHASHYSQVGCNFWYTYRSAIASVIAFGSSNTQPYGDGTETNAGVVAVGEMWAYCMQYIYTDRHYGNGGANVGFTSDIQGFEYGNIPSGLNCNLNAIENFDPNLASDVTRWIPQGLPYDLMDNRNDGFPVIDNVNGYTIQQCFNALQSDVRTIQAFRDRLLMQNGNNQLTNVNDLFFRYGY